MEPQFTNAPVVANEHRKQYFRAFEGEKIHGKKYMFPQNSLAKILMVLPNWPDMLPKRTSKRYD